MSGSIAFSELTFAWPDGGFAFENLDAVIGGGRTGLVGSNGSGKSTLLRLIAGELRPTSGTVSARGELGYLPQDLILDSASRVDEVLGVARIRRSIAAIESGDPGEEHFAVVGERWDVEQRTRATLEKLGLAQVPLDAQVGACSGGELVLLGLAARFLREPDVLLLDEPTNNLDQRASALAHQAITSYDGVLLIASHDRELLRRMDRIAELRDGALTFYGGNLTDYEQAVAADQEAAERGVRAAEQDLKRQRRELAEARIKLDRRQRYGRKRWETKREPKVRMRKRAEDAEIAAGKYRNMHDDKVRHARERLEAAEELVRDDDEIRIDLPATEVPARKEVLRLTGVLLRNGPLVNWEVRGPERIALVGANGAGKTTLLQTIMGELEPDAGEIRKLVPARYLPQRLDVLDEWMSAADNVAQAAPSATPNAIRAQLARFLLRGADADRPVGRLSGGERFRATLATLLLAEPAPRLLLLDEPTNNLDAASVRQLAQALESYAGALIVAGHDTAFLQEIGTTSWIRLEDRLRRC